MFELERFIEDCIRARKEDEGHKAVREVVARARALPPRALRDNLALTTTNSRTEDLAAIVATAGRPGLWDRVVAYRDKMKARKAASRP